MSVVDKIIAAVTPEASPEDMAKARAELRALSRGNDWISMVIHHHEAIEEHFKMVKSAPNAVGQRRAQKRLALLLSAHSIAEENVIYPAMALHDQKSHSGEAYTEQSAAKVQIAALDDLAPMSKDYLDKLEHLRAAVAHHVYEEESHWFRDLWNNEDVDQAKITKTYEEEFMRYLGGEERLAA